MAKPKTLAMLAMGKPPEGEGDEAPMDDEGGGEGVEQAMNDLLDAIEAKDPVSMAAAFQDAVAMADVD